MRMRHGRADAASVGVLVVGTYQLRVALVRRCAIYDRFMSLREKAAVLLAFPGVLARYPLQQIPKEFK